METGDSALDFPKAYVESTERRCPSCGVSLCVIAYGDDMYKVQLSCRECPFESDELTRLFGLDDSDTKSVFDVLRRVSQDAELDSP